MIPQEFVVDEQDGIKDPTGMSGVRLEAKVHIVTAAITSAENIVKCASRAGLNVNDIIDPRETRPVVIRALEMAQTKKIERPWKKHGVMPV